VKVKVKAKANANANSAGNANANSAGNVHTRHPLCERWQSPLKRDRRSINCSHPPVRR
jgi:hypothetical protein